VALALKDSKINELVDCIRDAEELRRELDQAHLSLQGMASHEAR